MRWGYVCLLVSVAWLLANPGTASAKCAVLEARVMADSATSVGLVFYWNPDTCEEKGFALPYRTFRDNKEVILGWIDKGTDELGYRFFNAVDQGPVEEGKHEYSVELYDFTGVDNLYTATITLGEDTTDGGADAATPSGDTGSTNQPASGATVSMCSTAPTRPARTLDWIVNLLVMVFF